MDVCDDQIGNKTQALSLQLNQEHDLFCCGDGICISWSRKCDNIPNCSDKSDETDCTKLILPNVYDKIKPPPYKNMEWYSVHVDRLPNDVFVKFVILGIYDINEKESTMTVRYRIERTWRDPRLSFRDLSSEYTRNTVGKYGIQDSKTLAI